MQELYQAITPFQYDSESDQVVFFPYFVNQSVELENEEQKQVEEALDNERLSKLTNWVPNAEKAAAWPVTAVEFQAAHAEDKIDFLFGPGSRRAKENLVSKSLYIGVYNSSSEPIECTIQMRTSHQFSLAPNDLRKKLEVYKKADQTAEAFDAKDREQVSQIQFTYGEVVPMHFIPLLEYVKPAAGDIFYDLGCGAGKPLLVASLAYPDLKVCKGIELLQGLTDIAEKVSTSVMSQCQEKGLKCAPIEVT